MKKIILTILIIIIILSINVLAVNIDIGMPAIDRGATGNSLYTMINTAEVANASGKITTVEIYSWGNLQNVEVATFHRPDPGGFPNNFTTRDSVFIGNVEQDDIRTFFIDLDVEAGDYIGMYCSGFMEKDTSGFSGIWQVSGDKIPCTNQAFTFLAGDALSLHGIGKTAAVGIKWNGVIITKWNGQVIKKLNGLP